MQHWYLSFPQQVVGEEHGCQDIDQPEQHLAVVPDRIIVGRLQLPAEDVQMASRASGPFYYLVAEEQLAWAARPHAREAS